MTSLWQEKPWGVAFIQNGHGFPTVHSQVHSLSLLHKRHDYFVTWSIYLRTHIYLYMYLYILQSFEIFITRKRACNLQWNLRCFEVDLLSFYHFCFGICDGDCDINRNLHFVFIFDLFCRILSPECQERFSHEFHWFTNVLVGSALEASDDWVEENNNFALMLKEKPSTSALEAGTRKRCKKQCSVNLQNIVNAWMNSTLKKWCKHQCFCLRGKKSCRMRLVTYQYVSRNEHLQTFEAYIEDYIEDTEEHRDLDEKMTNNILWLFGQDILVWARASFAGMQKYIID